MKNPVQKNLWKYNKKKIHKEKTKYDRKKAPNPKDVGAMGVILRSKQAKRD